MDSYISLHKIPCNLHGRTICGDCFFIRECTKPRCKCKKYINNGHAGGACVTCVHPPFMHRKVPLQLKNTNKDRKNIVDNLQSSLENLRQPDLSIPDDLGGITIDDAIVLPPEPLGLYDEFIETAEINFNTTVWKNSLVPNTLDKKLSNLEVTGLGIEHNNEYWKRTNINTVDGEKVGVQGQNVATYKIPPNYAIEPTQFWSTVMTNSLSTIFLFQLFRTMSWCLHLKAQNCMSIC